ncbi:CPBP family intramembrane metalloprotease [Candidatus Poribacteria bacterium]|nr:CPBP family intramembrane metalloprotease [Candidatus Poribacteria bacterium]
MLKYLVDDSLPINNIKYMGLYFITAGFSAVIIEELVFRQILYKSFRTKFNVILSIFFISVFFAFLHFYDLYYSIIPLLGGILFAILYEKTGNLSAPIILHSLGNLALMVLTIIYKVLSKV